METVPKQNIPARDVYSVTRLNREVRAILEGSFPAIWVSGEISNLALPASGHMYFSLKDRNSQLRCAMFKGRNRLLRFTPDNGMEVQVRGVVSLYEGRGEFQLIVEEMEPAGEGALQKAFEELKQRLFKEGLFDESRKQPLPVYPRTVGVITSPTGAAIRDILTVLRRRYPRAEVIIYPVPVQGDGAGAAIAGALETADRRAEADVLILARGGGSLEDLWSFNEEIVARAIYRIRIPIVSGVGHEIDFTIADFVADQRAPTPSAAAELVSPDQRELLAQVIQRERRCITHIQRQLREYRQTLEQLYKRIPHPVRRLQTISQRVDDLSLHLQQGIRTLLAQRQTRQARLVGRVQSFNPLQLLRLYRERLQFHGEQLHRRMTQTVHEQHMQLERLVHSLHTVSPLATLERGYGIVTGADGSIIRDAGVVETGEIITSRVAHGRIRSRVTDVESE